MGTGTRVARHSRRARGRRGGQTLRQGAACQRVGVVTARGSAGGVKRRVEAAPSSASSLAPPLQRPASSLAPLQRPAPSASALGRPAPSHARDKTDASATTHPARVHAGCPPPAQDARSIHLVVMRARRRPVPRRAPTWQKTRRTSGHPGLSLGLAACQCRRQCLATPAPRAPRPPSRPQGRRPQNRGRAAGQDANANAISRASSNVLFLVPRATCKHGRPVASPGAPPLAAHCAVPASYRGTAAQPAFQRLIGPQPVHLVSAHPLRPLASPTHTPANSKPSTPSSPSTGLPSHHPAAAACTADRRRRRTLYPYCLVRAPSTTAQPANRSSSSATSLPPFTSPACLAPPPARCLLSLFP